MRHTALPLATYVVCIGAAACTQDSVQPGFTDPYATTPLAGSAEKAGAAAPGVGGTSGTAASGMAGTQTTVMAGTTGMNGMTGTHGSDGMTGMASGGAGMPTPSGEGWIFVAAIYTRLSF